MVRIKCIYLPHKAADVREHTLSGESWKMHARAQTEARSRRIRDGVGRNWVRVQRKVDQDRLDVGQLFWWRPPPRLRTSGPLFPAFLHRTPSEAVIKSDAVQQRAAAAARWLASLTRGMLQDTA